MISLIAWEFNLPALVLLTGGLALILLAMQSRRLPPFPGQPEFVRNQLSAAWWSIAAAAENIAMAPAAKVFWAEMAWPGIIATTLYWTLFIWAYCKGESRIDNPKIARLLVAAPGLVWAIALTNGWHGLLYVSTVPMDTAPGAPILYGHGILFYVIVALSYLLMLFSAVVVADTCQRAPRLYRRHYFGFLLAIIFPWIGSIGYLTGTITPFGFDATPFSFILSGLIFYWLISRRQLFVLLPIALRPLLDSLPDAVMVLDGEGLVVEANAAATTLVAPRPLVGSRLVDLLPVPIPDDSVPDDADEVVDFRFDQDGERHFEVRTRLLSYKTRPVGRVIILTDITRRKIFECRLTEQLDANLHLQRKLREQVNRDLLTGLHNRYFLEDVRPALLNAAKAAGRPLSVVMLDLDHFKTLNDTWGHLVGDDVLRAVAAFFETHGRQNDVIVRIGGEEILILLPDTGGAQAAIVVERWRALFTLQPVMAHGQTLNVTFSAGIASYPNDATLWDELVQHADQALYRAKSLGRNRICRWERVSEAGMPGG